MARQAAEEARGQLSAEAERARSAVRAEADQAVLVQKLEQFNLLRESNAQLRWGAGWGGVGWGRRSVLPGRMGKARDTGC